jgi:hypothetical protein
MHDLEFYKRERGELALHLRTFLLFPKYWAEEENKLPIKLKWNFVKFEEEKKDKIPQQRGVYCFVIKPYFENFFETRYLFYVGKTNRTLRARYGEYLRDQKGIGKPRTKIYEMLNFYKNSLYFYYAEIPQKDDVDDCEDKLLNAFVPHINTRVSKATIRPELRNIYEL